MKTFKENINKILSEANHGGRRGISSADFIQELIPLTWSETSDGDHRAMMGDKLYGSVNLQPWKKQFPIVATVRTYNKETNHKNKTNRSLRTVEDAVAWVNDQFKHRFNPLYEAFDVNNKFKELSDQEYNELDPYDKVLHVMEFHQSTGNYTESERIKDALRRYKRDQFNRKFEGKMHFFWDEAYRGMNENICHDIVSTGWMEPPVPNEPSYLKTIRKRTQRPSKEKRLKQIKHA